MNSTDDSTFRLLVEKSPDGHFILEDGAFTYLNSAALRMFGWDEDPPKPLTVTKFVDPQDHLRLQRNILLRQSGALQGPVVYRGLHRSGETFPVEVHSVSLGSGADRTLHGTVRDVSQRQLIEAELSRQGQSDMTSRLVGGTAHDLNNLLAVVQASAELLEEESLSGAASAAVARILDSVQGSKVKIEQLTELGVRSKDTDGEVVTRLGKVADDVIRLTRARWKNEAERGGIVYRIDLKTADSPPVEANPTELRAALVALLFNALEAMPDGGPVLVCTGVAEDGFPFVSICDEGAGIDSPVLDDLSDLFYTTQPGRKVGLGLGLARRVAEEAGGRLEVSSRLGSGSTFKLCFPPAKSEPTEEETSLRFFRTGRVQSLPPRSYRPGSVPGRRILVVDDQADLVQVIQSILEQKGFIVDVALRASDGLQCLVEISYSLILTDLGMPDMSGWEFARRARSLQPNAPVLLMTGWATEIDDEQLTREGIHAVLPKPFRAKLLLDKIDEALGSTR